MVRSTAKSATNTLSFLLTSNIRALSGTAPRRRRRFLHVWTDATHPFLISNNGISVPIQNPFNPFTVPDYTSDGGPNPGIGFTTDVFYLL